MRIAGLLALLSVFLLQGCSDVLSGVRMVFPVFMFVVIIGALIYAIRGNRNTRREENDRRRPDADDGKK